MGLKDSWKKTGKSIGNSFSSLGKAIVKSGRTAADRLDDDEEAKDTDLRDTWSEVGHNFGEAGKNLGSSSAKTVKKAADAIDSDEEEKQSDCVEATAEEKNEEQGE